MRNAEMLVEVRSGFFGSKKAYLVETGDYVMDISSSIPEGKYRLIDLIPMENLAKAGSGSVFAKTSYAPFVVAMFCFGIFFFMTHPMI